MGFRLRLLTPNPHSRTSRLLPQVSFPSPRKITWHLISFRINQGDQIKSTMLTIFSICSQVPAPPKCQRRRTQGERRFNLSVVLSCRFLRVSIASTITMIPRGWIASGVLLILIWGWGWEGILPIPVRGFLGKGSTPIRIKAKMEGALRVGLLLTTGRILIWIIL